MKPLVVTVAAMLTGSAVVSGAARSETRETVSSRAATPAPEPGDKPTAPRQRARERDTSVETRPAVRVILASPYAQPK
jgi:hypothetical protein